MSLVNMDLYYANLSVYNNVGKIEKSEFNDHMLTVSFSLFSIWIVYQHLEMNEAHNNFLISCCSMNFFFYDPSFYLSL